ncbi:MAG: bifunctional adenosylcobinamide kinase/adenosylcobinamide-phosphate guanylyltransferase [Desulfobacteraceae bacterium]|jgi:adenosylcobinamide kinase/adenosylcobinamide-phosphate guanylyltransferase
MPDTTLIIGGCRSGKSSHALKLAESAAGRRNLFVATCRPHDDEMRRRIQRHQHERGDHWQTVEAPVDIVEVIQQEGPKADIVLIDCLTLWVSNLVMAYENDDMVIEKMEHLNEVMAAPPCPIILVTNEVGTGIVPENALARRFRDLTGWCNQKVAAGCGQVIWMVAGIPVPIKTKA